MGGTPLHLITEQQRRMHSERYVGNAVDVIRKKLESDSGLRENIKYVDIQVNSALSSLTRLALKNHAPDQNEIELKHLKASLEAMLALNDSTQDIKEIAKPDFQILLDNSEKTSPSFQKIKLAMTHIQTALSKIGTSHSR